MLHDSARNVPLKLLVRNSNRRALKKFFGLQHEEFEFGSKRFVMHMGRAASQVLVHMNERAAAGQMHAYASRIEMYM